MSLTLKRKKKKANFFVHSSFTVFSQIPFDSTIQSVWKSIHLRSSDRDFILAGRDSEP